jgi:hypothetical protein
VLDENNPHDFVASPATATKDIITIDKAGNKALDWKEMVSFSEFSRLSSCHQTSFSRLATVLGLRDGFLGVYKDRLIVRSGQHLVGWPRQKSALEGNHSRR